MNRCTRILAVLLLLGGSTAAARQNGSLDPVVAGRIDSVFARFTAPGSPGCALGIMRDGRLSYARGYGLASVELGVPITPATVFDLGSVSKQFTALAIVLLAQDGKLSLDDEVQRFVPEVPRYAKPVTLRHLLHHTSGIRDYISVLGWSGVLDEAVTGDREALAAINRQRAANFAAGAEFLYSNSGYFLLSVVVRRAAGKSLREFAAERIFAPLGMRHTFFLDDHAALVPGKAGSYAPRGGQRGFQLALANWEQTGDGAVQTTVEDLLHWERNFTTGTVGGLAGVRALETLDPLTDGKPNGYAFGLSVDSYRGLRRVGHGGAWAGFRAHFTRFPAERLALSALCNVSNAAPGVLLERVSDILLADRLGLAPAPAARPPGGVRPLPAWPRPLSDYTGRYRSEELFADWVLTVQNDSLRLEIGPFYSERVWPTTEGAVMAGAQVRFIEANGRIVGLSLTSRGARNLRLDRTDP